MKSLELDLEEEVPLPSRSQQSDQLELLSQEDQREI